MLIVVLVVELVQEPELGLMGGQYGIQASSARPQFFKNRIDGGVQGDVQAFSGRMYWSRDCLGSSSRHILACKDSTR